LLTILAINDRKIFSKKELKNVLFFSLSFNALSPIRKVELQNFTLFVNKDEISYQCFLLNLIIKEIETNIKFFDINYKAPGESTN
jgi:hypothetical protein